MAIKDITLALSDTEDSTLTLTSSNAVAIAIRNILLSQEGNFVNIPELNSDISAMLFDQIDDDDIFRLKTELNKELIRRIPSLSGLILDIQRLEVDNPNVDGSVALGISIMNATTEENFDMLIFKNNGNVLIL